MRIETYEKKAVQNNYTLLKKSPNQPTQKTRDFVDSLCQNPKIIDGIEDLVQKEKAKK